MAKVTFALFSVLTMPVYGFDGYYYIVSKSSGCAISLPSLGPTPPEHPVVRPLIGNDSSQVWYVKEVSDGVFTFRSATTPEPPDPSAPDVAPLYLTVDSGATRLALSMRPYSRNNTQLFRRQWTDGTPNSRNRLPNVPGSLDAGAYEFIIPEAHDRRRLDVRDESKKRNAPVQSHEKKGMQENQMWVFVPAPDPRTFAATK
jgi:hypothetical protein